VNWADPDTEPTWPDRDTEIGELSEREGATWDSATEDARGRRIAELEADLAAMNDNYAMSQRALKQSEADLAAARAGADNWESLYVLARQERDEAILAEQESDTRVARLEQALTKIDKFYGGAAGRVARDALAGGDTEPLTCPACGGTGNDEGIVYGWCNTCHGSGASDPEAERTVSAGGDYEPLCDLDDAHLNWGERP
jgi:hypothetical protein